jgi:predicted short-subunit dehydrogenase-like oxidoreductase (DUF2520 family)
MKSFRFIGPGRAGLSFARALSNAGFEIADVLGRHDDQRGAAQGVDVLVISTPDDAIPSVAAGVRPSARCVVVHLAASLGLDVLRTHPRRASLHPLVPLPNPAIGAERLVREMAVALGGRPFAVADTDRAAYHAAACVAANHVVALLGQVERIAAEAGLHVDTFLDLSRAAIDDVARLGPAAALTGPAARGDWATLERHRLALPEDERPGYNAGVVLANRLAKESGGSRRRDPVGRRPAGTPDQTDRVRAGV